LNESVYPQCAQDYPCRYRSRFARKVRVDAWCQKSGCSKTIGPPRECKYYERPECFLKKHSRNPPVFIKKSILRNPCAEIVTRDDWCSQRHSAEERRARLGLCPGPPCVERGERDFLRENALRVVRMPARRTKRCYNGVQDCCHLMDINDCPGKFLLRPEYGCVPDYIAQRNCDLYWEDQQLKAEMQGAQIPPGFRTMDNCERDYLINELRCRWDLFTREYLRLPSSLPGDHVTEGEKARLDQLLSEVEADLRLLTTDAPIFIACDPRDCGYL